MKSKNTMYMPVVLVFFICGIRLDDSRFALFIKPQFSVKVTNDLVYATAPVQSPEYTEKPLLLDLYEPEGKNAPRLRPGFIVVHSGGLVLDILDAEEPPLFIVHGADDNSVPVSEAYALAHRARRVAIPYEIYVCEGLGHNVPLDRRPA